jgi:Arc/MetJ family transcription regulator
MPRLTISLDEDLYALTKAVATAHDCSLSAAVNRLLRRALERRCPAAEETADAPPVVRCRAQFTSEDVDRFEMLDENP